MSQAIQAKMSNRILVVDDDFTTCLLVKRMVTELGFVCELASDGAEAVRAVSESHFDVVLMDIYMPVLSGLHASIAIRSLHPDSAGPAIYGLISGDEAAMRPQCIEAGMDGVLMKPIDRAALRGILHGWITPCASGESMDRRGEVTEVSGSSNAEHRVGNQDAAATSCTRQPFNEERRPPGLPTKPAVRPASALSTCPRSAPSPTQPSTSPLPSLPLADAPRPSALPPPSASLHRKRPSSFRCPRPPLWKMRSALPALQLLCAAIAAALALCALMIEALCAAAAPGVESTQTQSEGRE